jgi:hypothetical protein
MNHLPAILQQFGQATHDTIAAALTAFEATGGTVNMPAPDKYLGF